MAREAYLVGKVQQNLRESPTEKHSIFLSPQIEGPQHTSRKYRDHKRYRGAIRTAAHEGGEKSSRYRGRLPPSKYE